jgi:hypothetical protein
MIALFRLGKSTVIGQSLVVQKGLFTFGWGPLTDVRGEYCPLTDVRGSVRPGKMLQNHDGAPFSELGEQNRNEPSVLQSC